MVNAKINGCVGEVLFDSGAQISIIDEHFFDQAQALIKKNRAVVGLPTEVLT